jgi:hypothetical protein
VTLADVTAWLRGNRRVIEHGVVAFAIAGAGVWLGIKATNRRLELEPTVSRFSDAAARISSWNQFVPASKEERDVWATLDSASETLGIRPAERMQLQHRILELGDDAGLTDLRVTVTNVDTGSTVVSPRRKPMASGTPEIALYTIEVSFTGRFADAVRFVTTLPDAVFPGRVSVFQDATTGASRYRVSLTVYHLEPRANAG